MSRKALLAKLIEENPALPGELAKVSVAADLTILVAESGLSRSDLAKKLGWSRARVSQVLSGESNLTVETIHAVATACGAAFDVVFRKPFDVRAPQMWEREDTLHVLNDTGIDLTVPANMHSMLSEAAAGAMEFRIEKSRWGDMPEATNGWELADAA